MTFDDEKSWHCREEKGDLNGQATDLINSKACSMKRPGAGLIETEGPYTCSQRVSRTGKSLSRCVMRTNVNTYHDPTCHPAYVSQDTATSVVTRGSTGEQRPDTPSQSTPHRRIETLWGSIPGILPPGPHAATDEIVDSERLAILPAANFGQDFRMT
ncbi:hypothetical protein CH63R_08945 [Colletotrichum higginsianum IMI 349063]|uniref:Uncharacterized protein n=1 Tax=Colletotrichum higginsianum (strain IMI 349063) TaxID=759273 RepID=A0A1B7Y604_COLHI|nr:hypothetical protein CH63R_08945 [Colletotrichum higginsianum IMI 349063]OBR07424.1 hypothetical protein CH63R_08945 [Colletotrichum higginsianum IMI 349063]